MPTLSNEYASIAADAVCQRLNDGYVRIYDGTPEAGTLLVELRYIGYDHAVDGLAKARILPGIAVAAGEARVARHLERDGRTVAFDCSVGTEKAELILDNTDIDIGSPVAITNFTYRQNRR